MMKKQRLAIFVTACLAGVTSAFAAPLASTNQIVAVVNNQPITHYQASRYCALSNGSTSVTTLCLNNYTKRLAFAAAGEKEIRTDLYNNLPGSMPQQQKEQIVKEQEKQWADQFQKAAPGLIQGLKAVGYSPAAIQKFSLDQVRIMKSERNIITRTPIPPQQLNDLLNDITLDVSDYAFTTYDAAKKAWQSLENKTVSALPKPTHISEFSQATPEMKMTLLDYARAVSISKKSPTQQKPSNNLPVHVPTAHDQWHILVVKQLDTDKAASAADKISELQQKLAEPAITAWRTKAIEDAYIDIRDNQS